ncbi:Gfo/Idh/MocA family protein [Dokdonia donghaensis]|uniref:Oxidoreductase n=1 Tax=Dokdonia donghaensis DSW-1 TaxID=1300343 RepID=A0A0A2GRV6_9FLAO|nr:Gfo/Idh/MocA family oxidoreductase [Dokdonia donghaensis]ANH60694.1 1,5-anhydro-D-fructose reductase [Dokdonia donghaensis DSW-1]KGO06029.1 oxidoreductase [Dokdonia donghaensis DSW-1]
MTNWGILGCGKIADKFANDLLLTEGANLYAVASRDKEKAVNFGNTCRAVKSYGSYEEMAQDPDIDIVYIATPHMFHKENTLLCLSNNKAVLCEKAFAMNLEEVEEMIAFAKAKKIFLMEALWTHFLPHYKFVLDKVASDTLGEIQSLKADFGFNSPYDTTSRLYNKSLGGGSLLDVGIYPVFAALSLLGYTEDISAQAQLGPTGVDHNCTIKLRYPTGVEAQLFSAIDEQTDTTCHIVFDKGEIVINSRFHEPSSVTITENDVTKTLEFKITEGVNGYHYEILHCQEMLALGKTESDVMTFSKSKKLIMMLDTIRAQIGLSY